MRRIKNLNCSFFPLIPVPGVDLKLKIFRLAMFLSFYKQTKVIIFELLFWANEFIFLVMKVLGVSL
jgi:hypothetical protein